MTTLQPVAHIHSQFPEKFGIPRQARLVPDLRSEVIFDPPFDNPHLIRGLEDFSHIWLIWGFSQSEGWHPTVRPPRLGGNTRLGVFATRSPFRPNSIGLSAVVLENITERGTLIVRGADLADGTPIWDIKPYVPMDAISPIRAGFVDSVSQDLLDVEIPDAVAAAFSESSLPALRGVLEQDPRPAFHSDPERHYTFSFEQWEVEFVVEGNTARVCQLHVRDETR